MKTLRGAFLIFASSMALGLTLNAMKPEPVPFTRAKAVPQTAATISSVTLANLQMTGSNWFYVDARSPLFHRRGCIPGSINIYRKELPDSLGAVQKELVAANGRPIVVYCSGPSCADADTVAEAIAEAGFSPVHVFREGFDAWVKSSLGEGAGS